MKYYGKIQDAKDLVTKEYVDSRPSGGSDHNILTNRDLADQHPMSAITGLVEKLELIDDDYGQINEVISGLLDREVKIERGAYTGTGEKGSSAPNILEFEGIPRFFIVSATNDVAGKNSMIWFGQLGASSSSSATYNSLFTLSGTTLSWYSGQAENQFNVSKRNYTYLALTTEDTGEE